MLTRSQIERTARVITAQWQNIHNTAAVRWKNPEATKTWVDACMTFHRATLPTDYLWLDETRTRIKNGDREAIEDALLFLEVDPWYFRSGYLKERLIRSLKQAPLTEQDKERIRQIVISVARGKNRREFRNFCSLASKVSNQEFEQFIEQEAKEHDRESCGKFSYLLRYIRKNGR